MRFSVIVFFSSAHAHTHTHTHTHTHSLCPELQLEFDSDSISPHSVTLGSILTLNKWEHLAVNILPHVMTPLYTLVVVINGQDTFRQEVRLPGLVQTPVARQPTQYFLAGGAVSEHTSESHIRLVNAEKAQLSWKLCSLSILQGVCSAPLEMRILFCQNHHF